MFKLFGGTVTYGVHGSSSNVAGVVTFLSFSRAASSEGDIGLTSKDNVTIDAVSCEQVR